MKAGRELDAIVAEKVMWLPVSELSWPCGYVPDECGLQVYQPRIRQEFDADDEKFARSVALNESHRDSWLTERHPVYIYAHKNGWDERRIVPFYSTNIAAAWEVLEKQFAFMLSNMKDGSRGFFADIMRPSSLFASDTITFSSEGDSMPHAICLAVLKAAE